MFTTPQGVIKPIIYVGIVSQEKLLAVEYKTAPNPGKTGWWIQHRVLNLGKTPQRKRRKCLKNSEPPSEVRLHGVESFVISDRWHLIYHFVIQAPLFEVRHSNIQNFKWVSASEIAEVAWAHGSWEAAVAQSYLSKI